MRGIDGLECLGDAWYTAPCACTSGASVARVYAHARARALNRTRTPVRVYRTRTHGRVYV
jgi:hypothetical protein